MLKVETLRELLNGGVRFHVVFGERLACRELIDDLIGSADHFQERPKIIRNIIKIIVHRNYGKKTVCPVNLQGGKKSFFPLASCQDTSFIANCKCQMYVDLCSTSDIV